MSSIRVLFVAMAALVTGSAGAYEISHSYSADANATEFHGICKSGARIVIVRGAAGDLAWKGPAGNGRLKASANIDDAAKAACGE